MSKITTAHELSEALQNITRPFHQSVDKLPDVIYHYTTFDALKDILSSQRLWCTHYKYLNDPTELEYVFNLLEQIIEERYQSTIDTHLFKTLLGLCKQINYNIYIFSTCGVADDLTTWRLYAQDGCGFAVGIQSEELPCSADVEHIEMIGKVTYEQDKIKDVLCAMLDSYKQFALTNPNQADEKDGMVYMTSQILGLAPILKHHGYSVEQEYRLILHDKNPSQLGDNGRVPHFKRNRPNTPPFVDPIPTAATQKIKRDAIKEIWVGPRCDFDCAKEVIQVLLDKYNYKNVAIIPSKQLYRG